MNYNLHNATGVIPYGLTNDYMFHLVFQKDMVALKGLICAVLHLEADDIKAIEVCNPIEVGRNIDAKNFYLDLKIRFNDNTIVNLEMQIVNRGNWPERSLSYLCRSFDNLNKGEDYDNVCSAVHIGFIDFSVFPEEPEFCSTYMLSNVKTHRIYTGKFTLKVVELNQTELATEDDKQYKIDKWAMMFKATTWEELKMCAGEDAAMQSAVKMVYEYNEEEAVRDMCRARREALAYETYMKREKDRLLIEKEKLEASIEKLQNTNETLQNTNETLQNTNETLQNTNEELQTKLEQEKTEKDKLKAEIEMLKQQLNGNKQ